MSLEKVTIVNESWIIGMRRVDKIVAQEEAQGYQAWPNNKYSSLPDILVFDPDLNILLGQSYDALIRVYEVTNYGSPDEYVPTERAKGYRDKLLKFRAHKIFVCSFEENLRYVGGRSFFEQEGIEVQIMGYQD